MKVLYLGPPSPLIGYLESFGEKVTNFEDRLDEITVRKSAFDFMISYNYRHIISEPILNILAGNAINLHISFLPWNRGSDPNFWSFVENSPKGVTIHYMNIGLDTGDIIVQKEISFDEKDTLRTSYLKLHLEIQNLFIENWTLIRSGQCKRQKQIGKGSYHHSKDKEYLFALLQKGWDTPVFEINKIRNHTINTKALL